MYRINTGKRHPKKNIKPFIRADRTLIFEVIVPVSQWSRQNYSGTYNWDCQSGRWFRHSKHYQSCFRNRNYQLHRWRFQSSNFSDPDQLRK